MDKLKPLRDKFTQAERDFGRPLTAQEMAVVSNDFHAPQRCAECSCDGGGTECNWIRAAPSVQEAAKVLLENTPNPIFDTLKPVLMSEHSVTIPEFDDDGEECVREINVSWVVMKDIISHALLALAGEEGE